MKSYIDLRAVCLLIFFGLMMAGCGSAEPVEVEVTRVVTEKVVKEVEVIKEVEVTKEVEVEVEVTRIVEVDVVNEVEVVSIVTKTVEVVQEIELLKPVYIASSTALAVEKGLATTFPFHENDPNPNNVVGWWHDIDSTFIYRDDGTWGIFRGVVTNNPAVQYDGGTYELVGNTVTFTTDESTSIDPNGFPIGCAGKPGEYEIMWLVSGAHRIIPIKDPCNPRRQFFEDQSNPDNVFHPISTTLLEIPMVDDVVGQLQTLRTETSVVYSLSTLPVFYADQAITMWQVVFNSPELCEAGPYQCGLADVGSNRAAKGDILLAQNGGMVVDESGIVAATGKLNQGDTFRSALHTLPDGCPPRYSGCGEPVGLTNVANALIYFAAQSHGPALDGNALDGQIGSILGGCNTILGSGIMGFAVDFSENPAGRGECAFLLLSQLESPAE